MPKGRSSIDPESDNFFAPALVIVARFSNIVEFGEGSEEEHMISTAS